MKNIHWLGAGLSSIPGIRRLASNNLNLTVWNRTLSKAEYSINHVQSRNVLAKTFKLKNFTSLLQEGDIVVSQLPASMHIQIAKICLEKKCHFASTSYISPAIKELDQQVRDKKLIFINEIGLDPGIDHFFSHLLVAELQKQNLKKFSVSYKSFCGGIPAIPNDFKYKFSWSPIGVIKALNNPAIFIDNYKKKTVTPYHEINIYSINGEKFESYPNRDSLPYLKEYNFPPQWNIKNFIRGTLRLNGWTDAWKEIFSMLESPANDLEEKIKTKSDELWSKYQYNKNEKDRVVLSVQLDALENEKIIWSSSYELDEIGSGENSAMAKLVSITLSAGIDLILDDKLKTGVQAAPSDKNIIEYFFKILKEHHISIHKR